MAKEKLTARNEITNALTDDYIHIVQNNKSYKIKKSNLQKNLTTGYVSGLDIADTPTQDGWYFANETGTYTNAGSLVTDLTLGVNIINVSGTQTVFSLSVVDINLTPTGIVEDGNPEAVSGDTVYEFTNPLKNIVYGNLWKYSEGDGFTLPINSNVTKAIIQNTEFLDQNITYISEVELGTDSSSGNYLTDFIYINSTVNYGFGLDIYSTEISGANTVNIGLVWYDTDPAYISTTWFGATDITDYTKVRLTGSVPANARFYKIRFSLNSAVTNTKIMVGGVFITDDANYNKKLQNQDRVQIQQYDESFLRKNNLLSTSINSYSEQYKESDFTALEVGSNLKYRNKVIQILGASVGQTYNGITTNRDSLGLYIENSYRDIYYLLYTEGSNMLYLEPRSNQIKWVVQGGASPTYVLDMDNYITVSSPIVEGDLTRLVQSDNGYELYKKTNHRDKWDFVYSFEDDVVEDNYGSSITKTLGFVTLTYSSNTFVINLVDDNDSYMSSMQKNKIGWDELSFEFLGDSITAHDHSWAKYIDVNIDTLSTTNRAVSGATVISNGTPDLDEQCALVVSNPDVVVILCGTNDYNAQSTIGSISTVMGKAYASLDPSLTFLEGLRYCVETILNNNEKTRIVLITPIHQADITDTIDLVEYADAIIELAEYFAIPVIDAFRNSGVSYLFENVGASGRFLSDGLHPNETGKPLIASYIIGELKRILNK